jgi:hypothetical protein
MTVTKHTHADMPTFRAVDRHLNDQGLLVTRRREVAHGLRRHVLFGVPVAVASQLPRLVVLVKPCAGACSTHTDSTLFRCRHGSCVSNLYLHGHLPEWRAMKGVYTCMHTFIGMHMAM